MQSLNVSEFSNVKGITLEFNLNDSRDFLAKISDSVCELTIPEESRLTISELSEFIANLQLVLKFLS